MITRYALFEGTIHEGHDAAFRADVIAEMVPTWQAFPGALAVRIFFGESRDEGAPAYPLMLAIDFKDMAAVETFLECPQRLVSRAATEAVLARHFDGRVHHHVTTAHNFEPVS
jgi:hypothetical protein